jgi:hypothetical protein
VPKDALAIAFGLLLSGPGRAWVDTLRFEEVSDRVPVTGEEENDLPDSPANLTFEL